MLCASVIIRNVLRMRRPSIVQIVISVIGAGLGIPGTTINNQMKQNHMKRILGESQVDAIQETVENLSGKVSQGFIAASEVSCMMTTLKEQEELISKQRQELTQAIEESVKLLRKMLGAMSVYHNDKLLKIVAEMEVEAPPPDTFTAARLKGEEWQISTAVCILIAFLAFKYGF